MDQMIFTVPSRISLMHVHNWREKWNSLKEKLALKAVTIDVRIHQQLSWYLPLELFLIILPFLTNSCHCHHVDFRRFWISPGSRWTQPLLCFSWIWGNRQRVESIQNKHLWVITYSPTKSKSPTTSRNKIVHLNNFHLSLQTPTLLKTQDQREWERLNVFYQLRLAFF